jgi:hypothetical protein
MSEVIKFSHTARDGVAMFWILFIVFFPGGIMLGPPFMSVRIFTYSFVAFIVVGLGLTCKITVSATRVRFARRFFGIPYYVISGSEITSVTYDSDWDEEETASGVVVEIDGKKEIHIGSGKRKTALYTGLYVNSALYRRMESNQEFKPTPNGAA